MTNTPQFIRATDGRCVAASEILSITPDPAGGFTIEFRGGRSSSHAADLSTLGEIHRAARRTEAIVDGQRWSVIAWRICPVTNKSEPILGLPEAPLDPAAIFKGSTFVTR